MVPKMVPKNGPENGPKNGPENVLRILKANLQKCFPRIVCPFLMVFGPFRDTFFSMSQKKCLSGYFCVTFRADHFPQIRFFIAPTWGRFWPIFVFGKFSNFRTFFVCFLCIFGVCGPSLLSANAGIMVVSANPFVFRQHF